MNQDVMANLYGTTKQNISYHLNNIFKEEELNKNSTIKDFLTVQNEGNRKVKRNIEHYNLDAIIAVGYRINSKKATEFRIWATKVLREYMIKGFALNDERLKNNVKVHTLRSYLLEFVILDLQKKFSGEKYWIFMLLQLIMILGININRLF